MAGWDKVQVDRKTGTVCRLWHLTCLEGRVIMKIVEWAGFPYSLRNLANSQRQAEIGQILTQSRAVLSLRIPRLL